MFSLFGSAAPALLQVLGAIDRDLGDVVGPADVAERVDPAGKSDHQEAGRHDDRQQHVDDLNDPLAPATEVEEHVVFGFIGHGSVLLDQVFVGFGLGSATETPSEQDTQLVEQK